MSATSFEEHYPFKSNFFNLDEHRLHYLDEGEGPVLVMLHGNPTWSFYYRNLVKYFSKTHRVIVPDHMGCGFSDKPQDYKYRLKNHVKNLSHLLNNHLKIEKFDLIVHDWGGPIGLGYCADNPEKVGKIVAFNTTCNLCADYPKRIKLCTMPLLGTFLIRGLNFFSLGGSYMASTVAGRMDNGVREGYVKPYNNWANRIANWAFVQDIPFSKSHPTYQTGQEIMAKLAPIYKKDVMVIWGKKDFCFDDVFLEDWKKNFPDAEVHEFAESGHYVVEDATEKIIPLVEKFLNKSLP